MDLPNQSMGLGLTLVVWRWVGRSWISGASSLWWEFGGWGSLLKDSNPITKVFRLLCTQNSSFQVNNNPALNVKNNLINFT